MPCVTGVVFMAPKASPRDLAQAVGRALRLSPKTDKKMAFVILPVLLSPDDCAAIRKRDAGEAAKKGTRDAADAAQGSDEHAEVAEGAEKAAKAAEKPSRKRSRPATKGEHGAAATWQGMLGALQALMRYDRELDRCVRVCVCMSE